MQKSGPAGLREQAKGVVDEWRAAVDREQAAERCVLLPVSAAPTSLKHQTCSRNFQEGMHAGTTPVYFGYIIPRTAQQLSRPAVSSGCCIEKCPQWIVLAMLLPVREPFLLG